MNRDVVRSSAWGVFVTGVLGILILAGSRNLAHFDAALVAYTFAIAFATFGLTYRYAMWLSRPPTAVYWRRGWQAFFHRGFRLRNVATWFGRVTTDVMANRFIWKRERLFVPGMDAATRARKWRGWRDALERTLSERRKAR